MALPRDKQMVLMQYWLRGSSEDLAAAQEICGKTTRYHAGLFYAHLSVEKSLKAAVVRAFGEHPPYTHNLLHLVTKLGWVPDEEIAAILAEVNDFDLEGRYPDEKDSFRKKATAEFSRARLLDVQKVLEWISRNSRPES